MDPTLNLTATERVRTSVTLTGQSSPRLVNFDVGIELTQQLENLGLQFTLTAPEDMAMQEELTSKGPEERAKLAVSMLVTGMYLGGGGGGGKVNVNMGDALTSFLQSEINNIAGSALKSVDISFGMETYDDNGDAGGGTRTDYSFRFAKRFYNDRISIILGGRVSTRTGCQRRTVAAVHRQRFDRIPSRRQRNPLHQALPRQELRESAGRRDHRNRCRYQSCAKRCFTSV